MILREKTISLNLKCGSEEKKLRVNSIDAKKYKRNIPVGRKMSLFP